MITMIKRNVFLSIVLPSNFSLNACGYHFEKSIAYASTNSGWRDPIPFTSVIGAIDIAYVVDALPPKVRNSSNASTWKFFLNVENCDSMPVLYFCMNSIGSTSTTDDIVAPKNPVDHDACSKMYL